MARFRASFSFAVAMCLVGCQHDATPPDPLTPAVDAGPDQRAHPGDSLTVTAMVRDSGSGGGPMSWTLNWGDGATSEGSVAPPDSPIVAGHRYAAVGSYLVAVGVTWAKGVVTDTLTATIEPPGTPEVFMGAGDIATCTNTHADSTARIIDTIPGTVFAAGDDAYPQGRAADYTDCYQPSWGHFRKRTRPVPGNHDYDVPGAAGYFWYFGVAAGDPNKGYYSFNLGAWHIVALNSNLAMTPGSAEAQWLRADLAAHPARCTLAYWHHPRFSSGVTHGSQIQTQPLWQALYDNNADVVVSGHEHNYERFAPQTPDGTADSVRGIREFVAGTGGSGYYSLGPPIANSQIYSTDHGVLKLTLSDSSYHWQFIPMAPETFTDSGTTACH